MKLWQAILKGCEGTKQGKGPLSLSDAIAPCALGAARIGSGMKMDK